MVSKFFSPQELPMDLDPFVVLGISPTVDAAQIKRAYFAAITRHSPHRDPDAFQKVRTAYERLRTPSGLAAAFVEAPVSLEQSLAPYRERFDSVLANAHSAARAERCEEAARRRLIALVATLSWDRALDRFAEPSPNRPDPPE